MVIVVASTPVTALPKVFTSMDLRFGKAKVKIFLHFFLAAILKFEKNAGAG
jgi:hypothetical protein